MTSDLVPVVGLTAYTASLDACESRGLIAAACPEVSIWLVPLGAASP